MRKWSLRVTKYGLLFGLTYCIIWLLHRPDINHWEPNAIAHYIFNEEFYGRYQGGSIPYAGLVPFQIERACIISPGEGIEGIIRNDDIVVGRGHFFGVFDDRAYDDDFYTILFFSKDRKIAAFNFATELYELEADSKCFEAERFEIKFSHGIRPKISVVKVTSS